MCNNNTRIYADANRIVCVTQIVVVADENDSTELLPHMSALVRYQTAVAADGEQMNVAVAGVMLPVYGSTAMRSLLLLLLSMSCICS